MGQARSLPQNSVSIAMATDLTTITAQFPASDWQQALAGPIRQSQLDQDRVARVLHDSVGQNLSAAGLELGLLVHDFEDRAPELAARISELQTLLEKTLEQVREISRLNPSAVDHAGLCFALEHLIEGRPDVSLEFPGGLRVPRPAARALFRIAGYCLGHASVCGAQQIRLKVSKNALGWILEVLYDVTSPIIYTDSPANVRLGLVLLQYYAIRSGLTVTFEDIPGGGTKLRAAYYPDGESFETRG